MITSVNALRERMLRDLTENILPFWMNTAIDSENGGWYGEILRDGTVMKNAKKGLILHARILWSFSAAYRVLKRQEYLEAAERAFTYLTEKFLDPDGGAYYMLNAGGSVAERQKFTYAHGFVLYAFSEYTRATGKGIEYADRMFNYIERECRFENGYHEFAKGSPELDSEFGKMLTMNNHLHIIEPITNYFRIRRAPEVEVSLRNLLRIFGEHIISADVPHFDLYFDHNWKSFAQINSYGHDIEGSWLLYETAEVLGDEELLIKTKDITIAMAGAVMTEGLAPDTGAVFDGGDRNGNITEPKRVWWAQAEGVVGFFNAYQISGDETYLHAAFRCWDYIEEQIINPAGEWFGTGSDSEPDENTPYLVNAWKCPYHNTRATLEIAERAEG